MAETTNIHFSQLWRQEVQDQSTGRSSVQREPTFWLADGHFLIVSFHGREPNKIEAASSPMSLSTKALIPFMKATPS